MSWLRDEYGEVSWLFAGIVALALLITEEGVAVCRCRRQP